MVKKRFSGGSGRVHLGFFNGFVWSSAKDWTGRNQSSDRVEIRCK